MHAPHGGTIMTTHDEHTWEDDGGAIAPPPITHTGDNWCECELCGGWNGTDGGCTCGYSERLSTILNSLPTPQAALDFIGRMFNLTPVYAPGGQDCDTL
jgi:hypothetical protein